MQETKVAMVPTLTPLMRQYFDIKAKYPDTILLFQVGDFYELFFEDAQKAAALLGIALTQRGTFDGQPIPLCGVPLHVVDHYLTKLVRAGLKVALCDQLEIPKPGKVVDRGVTQVLTPGTLTDSKLLDEKSASYLCVFFPTESSWTLLFAELLTGTLYATILSQNSPSVLEAELSRFMPDEIVLPQTKLGAQFAVQFQQQGYAVSQEPFMPNNDAEAAQNWFKSQFGAQNGSQDATSKHAFAQLPLATTDGLLFAITSLYTYLKRNNEQGLTELKQLSYYKPEDYLMLDAVTQRNLELVKNSQDSSTAYTLFSVIDQAITPMGSRMLKKWLLRPLIKREQIEERLEVVQFFVRDHAVKTSIRNGLAGVGDLERIVGRIALKRAQLHDYKALLKALSVVPDLKALLMNKQVQLLDSIAAKIGDFKSLEALLASSMNDDTSKEWLIKEGYNAELDHLRKLVEMGAQAILSLEAQEQKRTGINSLKIRYNSVHGYGIEVTNANLSLVPSHYLRIQTLSNRERYTTQELKDLEYDLQRARTDITQVEKAVFEAVKADVELFVSGLKKLAFGLAYLDGLGSLAQVAYVQRYVRPTFNTENRISITDGRHPVAELRLQGRFIPNSVALADDASLWLITGPNMGGKSTFLRQVALITLMGQMGSFVPAAQADLAIVDRIFTRIGAADNVAEGKSTFLVEMEETALICNQATKQSLVILDEVGRGTSTYDGLAIAQAVVEYIYTKVQARCLFATHYHELAQLCEPFSAIRPYYAASRKTAQGVVLLHKIVPGVADGSFGLEVAAMAHIPGEIIVRARELLHVGFSQETGPSRGQAHQSQVSVPSHENILAAELTTLNLDEMTPRQALEFVWRLKSLADQL